MLAAAGVGLLFGHPWEFAAFTLAVLLALQIRNLLRFDRWLRHRGTQSPPDMTGL